MIGKQLDLFGGAPMPPKKIRVDEETVPEVSEVSPVVELENLPEPQTAEANIDLAPESPAPPVSQVFVQMPGVLDDPASIIAVEDAFPDWVEPEPETETKDELASPGIAELEEPASQDEESEENDFALLVEETREAPEEEKGEAVIPAFHEEQIVEIPKAEMEEVQEASEEEDLPLIAGEALEQEELNAEELSETGESVETVDTSTAVEFSEKGLNIPEDSALYSRQYYTMRETAAMFNVNQSLLRFWENEFDILKPKKNRKGDRYFRPEDIKNLELIYHLLRVRKFTIEGAKDYLKSKAKSMQTFEMVQRLEKLKLFLQDLKTAL